MYKKTFISVLALALLGVLLLNSCVSAPEIEETVIVPSIVMSHEEMKKNLDDGDIDKFIDNIPNLSASDKENDVEETLIWYIAKLGTRKLPKGRSLEAVKLLIEQGVDPLQEDSSKYHFPPVYYALRNRNILLADYLLSKHKEMNGMSIIRENDFWLTKVLNRSETIKVILKYTPVIDSSIYEDCISPKAGYFESFTSLIEYKQPDISINNLVSLVFINRATTNYLEYLVPRRDDYAPAIEDFLNIYEQASLDILEDYSNWLDRDSFEFMPYIENSEKLRTSIISDDEKKAIEYVGKDVAQGTLNDIGTYISFLSMSIQKGMNTLSTTLIMDDFDIEGRPAIGKSQLVAYYPLSVWAFTKDASLAIGELLIEKGANVNHLTPSSGLKGTIPYIIPGCTPLASAVISGNIQKVKLLVENGAEVSQDYKFSRKTLFDLAEELGSDEILNFLLENTK